MKVQRAAAAVTVSVIAAIGAGCESKSFLDPSEMGRYEKAPLVVPILDKLVVGVEADAVTFASAREVTDADLKVAATDYLVGPNDLLNITIQDLAGQGLQQIEQKRVSESGKVSLPYLGQVSVGGQTEAEIEATVIKAYADAQILPKAVIGVSVIESQNRVYSVSGAVTQPGAYPLSRADFRLWEAINNARGATSELGIEYVYVVRRNRPAKASDGTLTPTTPGGVDPLAPQSNVAPRTAPVDRLAPAPTAARTPAAAPVFAMAVTQQPAPANAEEARRQADELAKQIRNSVDNAQPVIDPAAPTATDRVIQIEGAGTQPVTGTDPAITTVTPTPALIPLTPSAGSSFEFTAPAEPTDQTVIKVPFAALKRGELKYNIVIQPQDMIIVPSPPIGEYYMGGHVARPGVYSLSAREITLKQAVISSGMLDQLAIPARTDVIRRIGRGQEVFVRVDLERIFAGLEPDIYLKPDDQVMVGTNIGAPFLAALRNAFRVTYGFGFLYDRNYAPERTNNN